MIQPLEIDRSPEAIRARLEVLANLREEIARDLEFMTSNYPEEAGLINRIKEALGKQ